MRSSDIPPIEVGVRSGEAPMRTEKPVSTWLNTLLVGGTYSVVGIVAPRFGGPRGVRGGANLVAESRRYLKALREVPGWLTLEGLMDWQKLNLGSTAISDDELIHLQGLRKLESLSL